LGITAGNLIDRCSQWINLVESFCIFVGIVGGDALTQVVAHFPCNAFIVPFAIPWEKI
jgi:hypothetical protein